MVVLIALLMAAVITPAALNVPASANSSSASASPLPTAEGDLVDSITAAQAYWSVNHSYRGLTSDYKNSKLLTINMLEPTLQFTVGPARPGIISVAVDGTKAPSHSVAVAVWSPNNHTCYYAIFVAALPSRSVSGPITGPGAWWAQSHSTECVAAFKSMAVLNPLGAWSHQLPAA